MAQELKIRLTDYKTVEEKIKSLGANLVNESTFTDTYFNQPDGHVLKISEAEDGNTLLRLEAIDGRFAVIEKSAIMNIEKTLYEMTAEFGVSDVLKGKRITYMLHDLKLQFNLINSRGGFLVITGDDPSQEFVTDTLEIHSPEYITVPFNELPRQTIPTT